MSTWSVVFTWSALWFPTRRFWIAAAALGLLAGGLPGPLDWPTFVVTARAESPDSEQAIDRHLAAGEFGPALEIARQTQEVPLRDERLKRVAQAQAAAGARAGAVATAESISQEESRRQVLANVASHCFVCSLDGFTTPSTGAEGALGGGVGADFDSLIELITSTIAPDSWEEVGGPGAIDGFEGGVYVDASGIMRRISLESGDKSLAALRAEASISRGAADVRKASGLRKVSLSRLERRLEALRAMGQPPEEAMDVLAGVYDLKYLFVYPETGDVVLAGPAGDWTVDASGRRLNVDTGQSVLRLDDLVTMLRNAYRHGGRFGCSITPRKENLAAAQAFLAESAKTPIASDRQRERWMADLRSTLGLQDIDVYGVDPRSRTGRILVEADYHMKLIGMGLEDGVLGVVSYLDALAARPPEEAAEMDVLRWWFTLNYDAIATTESRDGFEIRGPGVQVLSENELLDATGERIHTGGSSELNSEFARSFTKNYDALARKYPVYGELRNIFDLALAASILRAEDLPGQVGWEMGYFLPPKSAGGATTEWTYPVALGPAPTQVESIVHQKVVETRQGKTKRIVTGVSGGVAADTSRLVARKAIQIDEQSRIGHDRYGAAPEKLPPDSWWWD